MSRKDDVNSVSSLAESLLVSITEITESIVCIQREQDSFLEIGCYLYRASAAIMELHTAEQRPSNALDILQYISKDIDLAKELIVNFQKSAHKTSDTELRSIISQLQEVIKNMGEGLCSIPSSTYMDQKFAEIAVRSLSEEMQSARFIASEIQVPNLKERKEKNLELETDLYSVKLDFSTEDTTMLDMHKSFSTEFISNNSIRSNNKHGRTSSTSLTDFSQLGSQIEPLYDAFFCPLTKNIMEDPVTIETGVTYERQAISMWFTKCPSADEIRCPLTGQKLASSVFSTNIALKTTIEEWKNRNEVAKIKVARAALSLASSDNMILEAIKDLQSLCREKQINIVHVRDIGIIPLLVKLMEYKDRKVICANLKMILQLVKSDDECKRLIIETVDISTIIKMLSNSHRAIRHAALLVLFELSQSQSMCDKVGSVGGGILVLITIKFNHFNDAFASEKADEILKNLETSPNNIKQMAESGLLDPLLNHLIEGSEEMKIEMGKYLGEVVLGHDIQTSVAQKASPSLIQMVQTTNTLTRKAAFKALKQISSHHPNGQILVEAGIIRIVVEEIFAKRSEKDLMNSSKEATAIIANILESGVAFETLSVNSHGHTISSEYTVFNFVHIIKHSTVNELIINVIKILLCLTKSPKSMANVVSVIKETESAYTLTEFIDNQNDQLGIAAIKLLTILSPFMGHALADIICKTKGVFENFIPLSSVAHVTEKHAVWVNFLAKLPHQNLRLNLALLGKDVVPTILPQINEIQKSGTRSSRHVSAYLEGLVGILVRFTSTLYEPQMLFLARNHNFTLKFTELLMKTSSDEVQRLSAIGLENLSSVSVNLSKPPPIIKKTKFRTLLYLLRLLTLRSVKENKTPICPVHSGVCSSQNTFCLVDAKAVERLLTCMEHANVEVVEASMSAICTLMDDKIDMDKSLSMLSEVNALEQVLSVMKEHKQDNGLWEKSFWVIERFLMKGGQKSVSDISRDKSLRSALVSALHHGDGNTKQTAERILMHLNKIPKFSITN